MKTSFRKTCEEPEGSLFEKVNFAQLDQKTPRASGSNLEGEKNFSFPGSSTLSLFSSPWGRELLVVSFGLSAALAVPSWDESGGLEFLPLSVSIETLEIE